MHFSRRRRSPFLNRLLSRLSRRRRRFGGAIVGKPAKKNAHKAYRSVLKRKGFVINGPEQTEPELEPEPEPEPEVPPANEVADEMDQLNDVMAVAGIQHNGILLATALHNIFPYEDTPTLFAVQDVYRHLFETMEVTQDNNGRYIIVYYDDGERFTIDIATDAIRYIEEARDFTDGDDLNELIRRANSH